MNLTGHEVVLESQVPAEPGSDAGSRPSMVRLSSEGRWARVDEKGAHLGEEWVHVGPDLVHLTRLRRSRRLTGLPPATPGVRYIVPRLTARAAWHRADLVFPFEQVPGPGGRVDRARGLATFRPGQAVAARYRDWRAAARNDLSRRPLDKAWVTGLMFASATALLSGALGLLPGVADNSYQHGWARNGDFWTSWLTVVFGGIGLILLGWASLRWRLRGKILDERGTAYVIEEEAITWRHEEKASVLAAIGNEFAGVLRVPGPEALGANWHWQTDAASAGQWEARTDELVGAFWAVHYNDDQVTRNAVFTWAPWPVAVAFGARATALRRGLVLHVRQRPSYGAHGRRQRLRLTNGAHAFLREESPAPLETEAPDHTLKLIEGNLAITFKALEMPDASVPRQQGQRGRGDALSRTVGPSGQPRMLLLIVRLVDGLIDPIPMDLAGSPEVTVEVPGQLAASLIPEGTHTIPAAEWQLISISEGRPELPWKAFPAAAERIADWVTARSKAHPGHVVLLATRIPQELAVGLGIQLGQRVRSWPAQVYPVYYDAPRLVVPVLRLGAESLPSERT